MTSFFDSSHEQPRQSPGFLLWQVNNLWQRQQRLALEPLGITHVQFVLLAGIAWLTQTEEWVTQVQLAHHARTDVMMASQVIRSLEEKALLHRKPHPNDARANVVTLTEAGLALVGQAIAVVEAVDHQFFGILESQQAQFVGLLGQLAGAKE